MLRGLSAQHKCAGAPSPVGPCPPSSCNPAQLNVIRSTTVDTEKLDFSCAVPSRTIGAHPLKEFGHGE
jgi:hypothetical protein